MRVKFFFALHFSNTRIGRLPGLRYFQTGGVLISDNSWRNPYD